MNIIKEVTHKVEKKFVPTDDPHPATYLVASELLEQAGAVALAAMFLRRVDEIREWGYKIHGWKDTPKMMSDRDIYNNRPVIILSARLLVTR